MINSETESTTGNTEPKLSDTIDSECYMCEYTLEEDEKDREEPDESSNV